MSAPALVQSPWLCDYQKSYCRLCHEVVVWFKTPAGKNVALNPGWIRRKSEAEGLGLLLYMPHPDIRGMAFVTAGPYEREGGYSCHFATCRKKVVDDPPVTC